ncbi:hypothetical protein [Streptomyces sp. NBC_01435]|uniref:hypothetical protein n=1 Tax=Streptomyces sp. NBC_01435 TaxID=2903865 RepID=UPI002E369C27|nr:hypothetical protein [Streptomyces sp. NBC_01435]
MLKKVRTNRRHARLMSIADSLILGRAADAPTTDEFIALAFGRHKLRITEDEAFDYLNAGLVRRGHSPRPAPQATA